MKMIIFVAAIGFAMLTGFSSCKQCQICTKDSSPEVRICERDYNTDTEYGFAIDAQEAQGYNCKGAI